MKKTLRVLHLEDDRLHAEITRALLAEDGIEYEMARVATEADFVAALAAGQIDLILADFTLPEFNGMTALSIVKEQFPDLPFIFVTGTMGEEIAIDALKRGATDYILKGRLSRLAPAIRRALSETKERSERKRAEEALRSSEEELRHSNEMYRALIQAAPLAIFQLHVDGTVMSWNAAAERIFGWNEEEVVGELLPTVPQEKRKEFALTCGRILQGQTVICKELQRQRKDGVLLDISLNAAPVYDAQGNASAILAMVADISEQKNLEKQLRHAQKMEALGTLTGGIAHDFNNILTAIIGYGSLLDLKIDQNDSMRPFVAHILSAADRAVTLTKSLLAFGRKQEIKTRVVDLNSVVSGVESLLLRLLREDIELRTTFASSPCMVMADVGQIEQILMNLTANARNAMPQGGNLAFATSTINLDRDFVATHGYGTPGSYVLLTVTDNGVGMDAVTMSRIFEPFFTTKGEGKGTGLGLSIAYGIVKQHNGYINCYSEPGKGTTFRIYLPAVDILAEPVLLSSAECPPSGTETILLAEDDEPVRVLISSLLEKFGYTVITAHDGKDALVQFHANHDAIQLVLLDVIMPGKNGREACEEMRKSAPGLKALFTSGYSDNIFQRGEFDEPGFAFIAKPALPAELLRTIRQLLDE
jgi:two-component system, cell cycle sensor histidine kinase and response regulator CckA